MNFLKCAVIAVFTIITVFVVDSQAIGRRRIFARRGGCGQPIVSCQPICNNGICAVPVVPVVAAIPVVQVQQVFTPIFVPTFQFQYQPAPCYPAHVQQGFGYTQPGQQPVQNNLSLNIEKERIRALARALIEEMSKENDPANNQEDDGPPMALEPTTQTPPVPNRGANYLTVLTNRCASCHSAPNFEGSVMIFDVNGRLNPLVDREMMLDSVNKLKMPKGAITDPRKRLNQQEYNLLYAWAKSR